MEKVLGKNYEGLKVVDFTRVLAGPYLTMMLCDNGAEVIKIERPGTGADERAFEPHRKGVNGTQSGYYMMLNRGKKSITLDLNTPEAKEIVYQFVSKADLVVENFAPGVMKKLGFDYETLKEYKPDIIMCSISTFGQEGPLSKRPGYDIIAQASSGLMWMTGDIDRSPQRSGTSIADTNASTHALGAIGAALYYRNKTGKGQYIDISMRDCLSAVLETAIIRYTISNGEDKPMRSGSHHATMGPYGVYKAGDQKYVILAVLNPKQWTALTSAMGRPELDQDPRFATVSDRAKNIKEMVRIIEEWMQTFDDLQELLHILDAYKVPTAPVLNIEQVVNDEQYLMRNNLVEVEDPIFGKVKLPTTPMIFSETTVHNPVAPPLLGGNTEEVLKNVLNMPDEKIEELRAKNVFGEQLFNNL